MLTLMHHPRGKRIRRAMPDRVIDMTAPTAKQVFERPKDAIPLILIFGEATAEDVAVTVTGGDGNKLGEFLVHGTSCKNRSDAVYGFQVFDQTTVEVTIKPVAGCGRRKKSEKEV